MPATCGKCSSSLKQPVVHWHSSGIYLARHCSLSALQAWVSQHSCSRQRHSHRGAQDLRGRHWGHRQGSGGPPDSHLARRGPLQLGSPALPCLPTPGCQPSH